MLYADFFDPERDGKEIDELMRSSPLNERYSGLIDSPVTNFYVCRENPGSARGVVVVRMIPWIDVMVVDNKPNRGKVFLALNKFVEEQVRAAGQALNETSGGHAKAMTILCSTSPEMQSWIQAMKGRGYIMITEGQDGRRINEVLAKPVMLQEETGDVVR